MSTTGVGIVGAGQRGMRFFASSLRADPNRARLVAVADQDEERLQTAVDDLGGGVQAYGSLDAMLDDPEVEAVVITTPDFTHRSVLEATLEAGRHALCEKPMATTIDDAVEMTTMAMASEKVVQLGFMLRYAPFFVQLKELVDSGVIGRLTQINASEVVEYYHGASYFRRWHRFRKNSGGLLVHKAGHTLDAINWIVDSPPSWVSAIGGTDTFVPLEGAADRCRECALTSSCLAAHLPGHKNYTYPTLRQRQDQVKHAPDLCVYNSDKDSVDNALVTAEYDNGVRLSFSFATTGSRHERSLMLVGERGHIEASQAEGAIAVRPVGAEPEIIVQPDELRTEHGGGDEVLLDGFFQCIDSGRRPVADVLSGLYSVAVGAGATDSIEQDGRRVDLARYLDRVTPA